MKCLLVSLATLALLCPSALAATSDGDAEVDFARHLRAIAPYQAITEYERWLFRHPTHPLYADVGVELVDLYRAERTFAKARDTAKRLRDTVPIDRRPLIELAIADVEAAWRSHPDPAIVEAYERVAESSDYRPLALQHLTIYWIRARDWQQAAAAARRWQQQPGVAHARIERLIAELADWQTHPRPMPWLAAMSSAVLPGSGQVYAGNWPAGAASLAGNAAMGGLLLAAAWDRDLVGTMLALMFVPRYYVGGVLAASDLVERQIQAEDEKFIQSLLQASGLSGP